jgi:cytochrome c biogenesis factor
MVLGLFGGRSPLLDLGQAVRDRNPIEDLYVIPVAINGVNASTVESSGRGSVTLQVQINPLVGLIWLGGAVVGLGGFLALLPGRRRGRAKVSAPVVMRQPEEVPA